MRVKVAGTAGFCWGVQRALRAIDEVKGPLVTFRPLVYNGSVLARLDDRGASSVEVPSQIPAEATVALRPHGTLADDRIAIDARGARVLDLTCPHVLAVRDLVVRAREAGRRVVIAGNREHDEVQFLAEAAGSNHRVVASADEAEALVLDAPPALVAQSTLGGAIYEDIAEILKSRFPGTVILNTLCGASDERFEDARVLAEEADVVVVVGPYNSGSTRRIAELVRESGKQTFQVELPEDLQVSSLVDQARLARRDAILREHADDPEALKLASAGPDVLDEDVIIGVTAGAATAPWTVRAVVDRLLESTGAALVPGLPKDLAAEGAGGTVPIPVAPEGLVAGGDAPAVDGAAVEASG